MNNTTINKKLDKSFYCRNLLTVAKELLGKLIVKQNSKNIIEGRIVEVEAYDGEIDEAAHSYQGVTERNKIMFNEGGYLYVYLSYGVHYCCNIVTGYKNKGTAVLIRAVEPISEINVMIKNRFGRKLKNDSELFNLTSGPGKVCKALGINKNHSGLNLMSDKIYLLNQPKIKNSEIGISKRIGISKSVNLPWRFYIKENKFLSRK